MGNSCVLMFSGGRDSTLAALELARSGMDLLLVTITSSHLRGLDRVQRRLQELAPLLPPTTRWISVEQPRNPVMMPIGFSEKTCLPCQQAYVLAGFKLAKKNGIANLGLGYAQYQSSWPEQTPSATRRLRRLLQQHSITLHLPVYALSQKQAAVDGLRAAGLSDESLEQKCIKQVNNISLNGSQLEDQLDLWEGLLATSLDQIDAVSLTSAEPVCLEAI